MIPTVAVWAEPIKSGDFDLAPGDIPTAIKWFREKTKQEPKLIFLNPMNKHLAREAGDGITVMYRGGVLAWEVWLSAEDIPDTLPEPNESDFEGSFAMEGLPVPVTKMSTVNEKPATVDIFRVSGGKSHLRQKWVDMKYRCFGSNIKHNKYWGARGITICEEWLDYNNFEGWALANGYSDNLTIDRINNDRGYCPENCQWVTKSKHAEKTNRGRQKTYKKRELPEELISQLHAKDMGSKAIASRLKAEQGIKVSYKTIQRVLSGKRKKT